MTINRTHVLKIAALAGVLAGALWLAVLARENSFIQTMVSSYGYFGILVISFASGFNLLVPIPAVSFLPLYAEAGLSIPITIALITVGMTAADSIAYGLGRIGRDVATEIDGSKIIAFLDRMQARHKIAPLIVIFLYASFAPLPNEVIAIPLGIMRFRFTTLLPLLVAGNMVFNTLLALGVLRIFDLFA